MKMLRVVLPVMLGLTLVRGQESTPRPCCVSHQFTANMGEVGQTVQSAHGVHFEGRVQMTYDYEAKLLALTNHIFYPESGTITDNRVIEDYNTHTMYIINANGECFTQPLRSQMIEPCVPSNATYLVGLTMGSGNNALKANVWQFSVPATDGVGSIIVNLAVQADNCTPIVQNMHGHVLGTGDTELTFFFTNYRPSISDRSSLALPAASSCRPLPNTGGLVGR